MTWLRFGSAPASRQREVFSGVAQLASSVGGFWVASQTTAGLARASWLLVAGAAGFAAMVRLRRVAGSAGHGPRRSSSFLDGASKEDPWI